MKELSQGNKAELASLLSDRLVFARTNAELYTTVTTSVEQSDDLAVKRAVGDLKRCAAEEAEHATWLEVQLRNLGDHASTSESAAAWAETARNSARIGASHLERKSWALFAAELLDHAGWHTLLQLADEVDDGAAKQALRKRLLEKDDHLHVLRQIVHAVVRRRILGGPVREAA